MPTTRRGEIVYSPDYKATERPLPLGTLSIPVQQAERGKNDDSQGKLRDAARQAYLLDASISEKDLQDTVIDLALAFGWTVYHARDSRGQRLEGLPDLELLRPPKALRVELKREHGAGGHTNDPTPLQERTIALLRACGQDVRVWRPSDLRSGEIERVLRGGP